MKKRKIELNALEYISAGVVCFSLILLEHKNLLQKFVLNKELKKREISFINNDVLLSRAFLELEINKILQKKQNRYLLTDFGQELVKYLGLVKYIYHGYAPLFSNQLLHQSKLHSKEIRIQPIIEGSNDLANVFFDPVIIKAISRLRITGTICDLGCGDGSRLKKVCKLFLCKGLGIDRSFKKSTLSSSALEKNTKIRLQKGNIANLKDKIWPDVHILMQTMVMHDITPAKKCIKILNSYLKNFPNLKIFLYCDIVAPCNKFNSQLPGFDYIHGMLNIKTRTYDETIKILSMSKFKIIKECPIKGLPNTFLWILGVK